MGPRHITFDDPVFETVLESHRLGLSLVIGDAKWDAGFVAVLECPGYLVVR